MNLSGDSVAPFIGFHKILPEHICVIHDDIDLPAGEVKYKIGGGSGGQNGLKDITKKL
jgi:PTH1 family peptidyl-tRNA hydrolase